MRHGSGGESPVLSVIVIAYNDAERLPSAVRSALGQALRDIEIIVVDDASTDRTGAVADALAAEHERISVVHLPENSGGCSRPRNAGLARASGRYVMFLDSDDAYVPDACERLMATAIETGAEIVMGAAERVLLRERRSRTWRSWLYETPGVYNGIEERPELLYDTAAWNKLYSRALLDRHGIRFAEGYHYEDILFTGEVLCHARRIAVIPEVVYRWTVERNAESPSISHRRHHVQNFADRVAVHEQLDTVITDSGKSCIKPTKDRKFLRHDLRLYLYELPWQGSRYRNAVVDMAADYLGSIDRETLDQCEPMERVCYLLTRRRAVTELLTVVDYLQRGRLTADLARRDGRIYWSARFLDSQDSRDLLDVTSLQLQTRTLDTMPLGGWIEHVDTSAGKVTLDGACPNPLGLLRPDEKLTVHIDVSPHGRSWSEGYPATDVRIEGTRVRFRGSVDVRSAMRGARLRQHTWLISARIARAGESRQVPLSLPYSQEPEQVLSVRAARLLALGARVILTRTAKGDLALALRPSGVHGRLLRWALRRWRARRSRA